MAICTNCGKQLAQDARFCDRCGKPTDAQPTRQAQNTAQPNGQEFSGLREYTGTYRTFPFVNGLTIEVPAGKDAFNNYILQFHRFANIRMRAFQKDYRRHCTNFFGYMDVFADVNGFYVNKFIEEAVGLLISCGYYQCTAQDILEVFQQMPGFKNLDDFHNRNLELGNAYLQDNYNRAVNRVNNMNDPTFFGIGVRGMAMSYGLNAASGAIQNRRANKIMSDSQKLTPAQEREFFSIVKEEDVMFYVWDELVNIGYSTVRILSDFNEDEVCYPYQTEIDDAMRLAENMQNPRFPRDQIAGAAKYVLEEYPHIPDLYPFLKRCFGDTPQIRQIEQYFYPPQIRNFFRVFPEYDN